MLPKIKAKEKERLKRVRGGGNEKIDEVVDPMTIASVVVLQQWVRFPHRH